MSKDGGAEGREKFDRFEKMTKELLAVRRADLNFDPDAEIPDPAVIANDPALKRRKRN